MAEGEPWCVRDVLLGGWEGVRGRAEPAKQRLSEGAIEVRGSVYVLEGARARVCVWFMCEGAEWVLSEQADLSQVGRVSD